MCVTILSQNDVFLFLFLHLLYCDYISRTQILLHVCPYVPFIQINSHLNKYIYIYSIIVKLVKIKKKKSIFIITYGKAL